MQKITVNLKPNGNISPFGFNYYQRLYGSGRANGEGTTEVSGASLTNAITGQLTSIPEASKNVSPPTTAVNH